MKNKLNKKGIIIFLLISAIGIFYFLSPILSKQINWHLAKKAIAEGGFTFEIGLAEITTLTQCVTTGDPPVCGGGTWCYLKDAASCTSYYDVEGIPAGGDGNGALFLNSAILQAGGLMPGGQLIAGGISQSYMDQGVLASANGCYNCLAANASKTDKFLAWFDKYIIAGFRGR